MKKYTIFSFVFIFGIFLMTGFIANDDHDRQKRPIAVNDLPEDVREAIQENYEGYRVQQAFIVTRNGDGPESQGEGVQRGTQREGVQQGTERTGTQREGVRQGTERTGTQREGVQQGTERTGTQREGVQQGTERTGTQRQGQTETQRGTGYTGTQTERSGAERSDDEGILGGIFSSDDEDTYYEVVLAKGQETKTVKFNEDGDELDKDRDQASRTMSDIRQQNRTSVEATKLPEPVMESIRDNYEDYRITEAFIIKDSPEGGMHHQEGAEREGVRHEGAEHTRREGAEGTAMGYTADRYTYYEVKLAKEDETKTVVFTADGDEIAEDEKDRIYVIENEKKERK
jgi:hypothetical protein